MSKLFPFLFFVAFVLFLDIYAWQGVRVLLEQSSISIRRGVTLFYWTIPVLAFSIVISNYFISMDSWPTWLRVYGIAFIVLFYICKVVLIPFLMIDDITRIFRWVVSLFSSNTSEGQNGISRYKFLVYSGVIISGFLGLNLVYGMLRNAYRYKLHQFKLHSKHLPEEFASLRIVQISDIHSGSFTRTSPIEEAIERINSLQPDLILFTGDLVNNVTSEVIPYKEIFSKLSAKHGVFSILGNHDYGDYHQWETPEAKEDNLKELISIHKEMGWQLLMNENVLIVEKKEFAIIGVENWSNKARFPKYGKLHEAVKGTEDAKFKILLSHDPSHWEAQTLNHENHIHLTLSGHTHGMQFGIEIPGFKWSPIKYIYPQWAGAYEKKDKYIYVNRGFGFLGFPGRVGILPEITVIELLRG